MSTTRLELPDSEQGLLDLAERLLQDGREQDGLPDRSALQGGLAELMSRGFSDEVPKRAGERVGHYRIAELLGQGGMGAVYRGYDELLDRQVAIKTLRFRPGTLSAEARARLLREARSLAKLDHPG